MKNRYIIDDKICWIELTQGQWAQIDVDDMDKAKNYRWFSKKECGCFVATGHIGKRPNRHLLYLHRLLMSAPKGMQVDHIFHNRLDNRSSQMRLVSNRTNSLNKRSVKGSSSQYLGVEYRKNRAKPWRARVNDKKKAIYDKNFACEHEAGVNRARAFVRYYGSKINPKQFLLSKEVI